MKARYRIVTDKYLGYEVQVKKGWFPCWRQCHRDGFTNTFNTVESAREWILDGCPKRTDKRRIIEEFTIE